MITEENIADVNYFLKMAEKQGETKEGLNNIFRALELVRTFHSRTYRAIEEKKSSKNRDSYKATKKLETECQNRFSTELKVGDHVRVVGTRDTRNNWRKVVSKGGNSFTGIQCGLSRMTGEFVYTGQYTTNGYSKCREIWSNPVDKAAKYFLDQGLTSVSTMVIKKWIMPRYKLSTQATELMIQRRLDEFGQAAFDNEWKVDLNNFKEKNPSWGSMWH
jgi:hypothetical protein